MDANKHECGGSADFSPLGLAPVFKLLIERMLLPVIRVVKRTEVRAPIGG
jgi:hypothetical protein